MSDLEQSDIENMSEGEGSVGEIDGSSIPTFGPTTGPTEGPTFGPSIKTTIPTEGIHAIENEDENGENDQNEEDPDEDSQNDDDDDDISIIDSDDGENDEDGNDDDISIDEETGIINKKTKSIIKKATKTATELPTTTLDMPVEFEKHDSDYESDEDEEEEDDYLQKFDREMRDNYILDQHPDSINHNYDEIYNLAKVKRNKENIIIDDLHKTIPLLTKYEKTRILGQRAKQLNNGAKPLVKMDIPLIDGYLIALKELEEKMIPVIIRRPLPSGASEYWHLKDLEIL